MLGALDTDFPDQVNPPLLTTDKDLLRIKENTTTAPVTQIATSERNANPPVPHPLKTCCCLRFARQKYPGCKRVRPNP